MKGPDCTSLLASSILSTRDVNGFQGIDSHELASALKEIHSRKSRSIQEGSGLYREEYVVSGDNLRMVLSQLLDDRLSRLLETGDLRFSNELAKQLKQCSSNHHIRLRVLLERAIVEAHESLQTAELLSTEEILKLKQEKFRLEQRIKQGDHESYKVLYEVSTKLSNHNLVSALMGQLSDPIAPVRSEFSTSVPSSRGSSSTLVAGNTDIDRALEDLLALVMSLSIQKNVELSQPDPDVLQSLTGKINWATDCVSEIFGADTTGRRQQKRLSTKGVSDENDELLRLQTAVKDLNFSQKYLGKQFDDERAQYHQTISSLRKNLQSAQNLLVKSNTDLTQQTNMVVNMELKLNELETELTSKKSELLQATKELNLLRVDSLTTPTTPTMPGFDVGGSPNKNVSVSILRSEFKKLVSKINEKYEEDLEKERTERKRLEELVKMYESGNSHT